MQDMYGDLFLKTCDICGSNIKVTQYKNTGRLLCNKHRTQMARHNKIIRTRYDPNCIFIKQDYAEICLYNKCGKVVAITKIDVEDVDRCSKYKWCLTKNNYVLTSINGRFVYLHRFLLDASDMYIDHINFDTLDNRKSNLRACTNSNNLMHRSRLGKNNTTGLHGIIWCKGRSKWRSEIQCNNKVTRLGYFNNKTVDRLY